MKHETRSRDTSEAAAAKVAEIYGRMSPERKLRQVDDAIRTARFLAFQGLRARHPGEPVERLRRRLLGLVLGEELANRVYGPLDPQ